MDRREWEEARRDANATYKQAEEMAATAVQGVLGAAEVRDVAGLGLAGLGRAGLGARWAWRVWRGAHGHLPAAGRPTQRPTCTAPAPAAPRQVVAATCTGCGDPRLGDMTFKVVAIDEASQATEPSTLIPLLKGAQAGGQVAGLCVRVSLCVCVCPALGGLLARLFAGTGVAKYPVMWEESRRLRAGTAAHTARGLATHTHRLPSGAECVVMAGDIKQLPPTVVSRKALE